MPELLHALGHQATAEVPKAHTVLACLFQCCISLGSFNKGLQKQLQACSHVQILQLQHALQAMLFMPASMNCSAILQQP